MMRWHAALTPKSSQRREELDEVLRAAARGVDGEVLDVERPLRRLRHPGRVADGEADQRAALLEEQRVAEGEAVDDLDLLGEVEPPADAPR